MTADRPSFLPAPKDRDPEPSGFVFPGPADRLTVNGMTGSGKTTFAMWMFAESADFNKKPWILLDYKGETLISQMLEEDMAKVIKLDAQLPKSPGVYVARPAARDGPAPVVDFLWKIYEKGKCGLFLDEATMVPELRGEGNSGGPFQSLLSQGRSKEIPVWVLAQRPAFVNKMVYTESNYYCAFRLRSDTDFEKVKDNIPEDSHGYNKVWGRNSKLPRYHSRWYDAEEDRSYILKPVPGPDEILNKLFERVDNLKKRASI